MSVAEQVSKQRPQHMGGCCIGPGQGGMRNYLQNVSEVRCRLHSHGSLVQLLKMGVDCQGRPWKKGHQDHKQTYRHTALRPPGKEEKILLEYR